MTIPLAIIKKIKNSLKLTVGEAVSSAAVTGFGNAGISAMHNQYISAYALALKATNSEISLILAVPLLVSSIVQLKAADLIKKLGSRKKVAVIVGLINILLWLPFILIPFIFKSNQVWWFLAFFTMITVFWTLDDPAWESLVSDLVPTRRRGKFFGRRKLVGGVILLASSFMAGYILSSFQGSIFTGFFIIFTLAMLARFVSWVLVTRIYEPPMETSQEQTFKFSDFIKDVGHSKAGAVIFLSAFMNLAIYLAAPFYAVYMLQDMKLDLMTFTLVNLAATTANLVTLSFWGKKIDNAGPLRVISFTSMCIAFVPLLWVLGHKIPYLMMVQFLSGFLLAGFNLGIPAFIYTNCSAEKRARYLSYLYSFNMGMAGTGTIAGGFLVTRILDPQLLSSKFLDLFLIAGVLSGLVAFAFLPSLIEAPVIFKRYFKKPKHDIPDSVIVPKRIKRGLLYHIPHLPFTPAPERVKMPYMRSSLYYKLGGEITEAKRPIRPGLYYNPYLKTISLSSAISGRGSSSEYNGRKGLYYFLRSAE